VNQKKCPKCGENNPVEAVMCWACYTPLSGSVAAGAGAVLGGPTGAAARGRDREKKAIAPWQIGVIAAALLVVAGGGFMAMRGSSDSTGYDGEAGNTIFEAPPPTFPFNAGAGGSTAPAPPTLNSPVGQQTQGQPVAPYTVTTQPDPNSPIGMVGIVPRQAVDPQRAAALAAGMSQRLSGRWKNLHIYVFADTGTARNFNSVVRANGGRALSNQQYQQMRNVWAQTLARIEIIGGRRAVRYPSANPGGWW
jgi:hypothetical protein